MGNKGGTLCSALPQGGGTESHRGDAGMRGGQAKSSVLMGGKDHFTCMEGNNGRNNGSDAQCPILLLKDNCFFFFSF